MKVPGGGLLSTAEDLVRYGIALNTARLLKTDTVEMMWTQLKTSDGTGTGTASVSGPPGAGWHSPHLARRQPG